MIKTYLILRKIVPKPICHLIIINAFPIKSLYGACIWANKWVIKKVTDVHFDNNILLKMCIYSSHGKSAFMIDFIKLVKGNSIFLRVLMKMACKYGNFNIVEILIKSEKTIIHECFKEAVKCGHLEIVKLFPKNLIYQYHYLIAAIRGHHDVVEYLKQYTNRENEHLICGQMEYIYSKKTFLDSELDILVKWAVLNNSLDVFEYFENNNIRYHPRLRSNREDVSYVIAFAAKHGKLDVIKYLIKINDNIFYKHKSILSMAAKSGFLNIVQYLVENVNFKIISSEHVQREIIEHAHGRALDYGHFEVADYLLSAKKN